MEAPTHGQVNDLFPGSRFVLRRGQVARTPAGTMEAPRDTQPFRHQAGGGISVLQFGGRDRLVFASRASKAGVVHARGRAGGRAGRANVLQGLSGGGPCLRHFAAQAWGGPLSGIRISAFLRGTPPKIPIASNHTRPRCPAGYRPASERTTRPPWWIRVTEGGNTYRLPRPAPWWSRILPTMPPHFPFCLRMTFPPQNTVIAGAGRTSHFTREIRNFIFPLLLKRTVFRLIWGAGFGPPHPGPRKLFMLKLEAGSFPRGSAANCFILSGCAVAFACPHFL